MFETLRERIVAGEYASGHNMNIADLATEFGVSAGPVREALRQLDGRGLIRHQPNLGAKVLGVDEGVFKETLEVMAVLEGLASGLSSSLLTPEDRRALRDLNERMAESSERGDMLAFRELNRSFHHQLYARCPNTYLLEQIDNGWDRLEFARMHIFIRIPLRHKESLAEHRHIIELVEDAADPSRIEEVVREHKRRTLYELRERERQESEANLR